MVGQSSVSAERGKYIVPPRVRDLAILISNYRMDLKDGLQSNVEREIQNTLRLNLFLAVYILFPLTNVKCLTDLIWQVWADYQFVHTTMVGGVSVGQTPA